MAAGVLILLVIVELVISVWCLTRFNGVLREVALVEKSIDSLTGVIRNWSVNETPVKLPENVEFDEQAAKDVLSGATDEQVAAAAEVLKKLGIGGYDK